MNMNPIKKYENVPVMRSSNFTRPEDVIGRAVVEIGEKGKALITIETTETFVDFINMGNLQALTLSAFINQVDSEKAKEYWSQQQ